MNGTRYSIPLVLALGIACATTTTVFTAETGNPFIGYWDLTIPGGGAGWLGVTQETAYGRNGQPQEYLDASILWGGGSVVPAASVYIDGDVLYVTRTRNVDRRNEEGEVIRTQTFTETITARLEGDTLIATRVGIDSRGGGLSRSEFTGIRTPPLPPKPDLSLVKYGEPIQLIKGNTLDGWTLTNPRATSGWRVEDGVLINDPARVEGERISYGNLCTVQEFEDFNLTLETNIPERGNSGVYLRGIYEIQVSDSYGQELDPHNFGALYSRITPSVNAEKPAGEWQTMDITLLNRHLTVKLNGTTIIDNEPLLGCTGGALWADQSRPGPIYLQGDHTSIKYRNIVLRPIIN